MREIESRKSGELVHNCSMSSPPAFGQESPLGGTTNRRNREWIACIHRSLMLGLMERVFGVIFAHPCDVADIAAADVLMLSSKRHEVGTGCISGIGKKTKQNSPKINERVR